MAAVTLSEVKSILNITDTSKDTLISTLIPVCTEQLKSYCNNRFWDPSIKCELSDVKFVTTNKIQTTNYSFLDYKFKAGMELEVVDSILNDNLYIISTITATEIVITTTNIVNEDEAVTVTLARVKYPVQIKNILAMMIQESIAYAEQKTGGNISSVTLGSYSVSYIAGGQFSKELKNLINQTLGRNISVK